MSNRQSLPTPTDGFPDVSVGSLANPLSAVAFWLAIALPVLYIPLLTTGIHGLEELTLFLGVFGLHLLALVAGRSYRRE